MRAFALPVPSAGVVDGGGLMTPEWYRHFQDFQREALRKPVYDIRDYIIGLDLTGTRNVASDIQTAWNSAATDQVALWHPPGTYLSGGTRLRVPSNSRLYGAGERTSFKRTVDDTEGTIEVYEASDVLIQGLAVLSSLTTHTLGYGQTGFCVRNGSTDVTLIDCHVNGELNRKFQIINSARVKVINCVSKYGEGNATLRVVSDHDADTYPEFSDEDAPIPVDNVWIEGCYFNGASALNGTTRSVDYGINVSAVTDATDACSRVKIRNNTLRFYKNQGIGIGGNILHCSASGNDISHVYVSTSGNGGTGILVEEASTDPAVFTRVSNNSCQVCDQGIYVVDATYTVVSDNQCYANLTNGILINGGNDIAVSSNICLSNASNGIYVTGSAANVSVIGNHMRANTGYGIDTDAGVTAVQIGNIALGNTAGQYNNAGTITDGDTGTPPGNM